MMEKDLNKQQRDKLIRDWTDDLLDTDMDDRITDCLMDFVENDDTDVNVADLIDSHIHQLAMEESITKRRKWKIIVSSAAAASVVLLIVAAILLTAHPYGSQTDKKIIAVENIDEGNPTAIKGGSPLKITGSAKMLMAKAVIKGKSEIETYPSLQRERQVKEARQKEAATEPDLSETIAEINAGLVSMADNAKECLNMTNVSLLPENLFSDSNDSNGDEHPSPQYIGQMQELNIIETNLINTLYEIRNLNIDLNFESDNKKTEI